MTTFQPLTKDQYEKARSAGFSHEQILANEQRRKSESVAPPAQQNSFGKDVAIGVGKELGSTAVGLGRVGEGFANQTVGRLVSAATGKGFVPLPKKDLTYSSESATGQQMDQATTPTNFAQKTGFYGSLGLQMLTPFAGPKLLSKFPSAAKATAEAVETVSPKMTPARVRDAYKTGRANVSGLFKQVTVQPDLKSLRAGEAAKGVVKASKTAAENSKAVWDEIGKEARSLDEALASRDVKLIVQPEQLQKIHQSALERIGEDPHLVGNAAETAKRIFNKFNSYLPRGRDVTAEDVLAARRKLDRWIEATGGGKVFDPAVENAKSIALRAIRQETNDLVQELAPDVAVKASLARQSALYDALEGLATKGPSELGTTSVGRFFMRHPMLNEIRKSAIPVGVGGGVGGYLGSRFFGD